MTIVSIIKYYYCINNKTLTFTFFHMFIHLLNRLYRQNLAKNISKIAYLHLKLTHLLNSICISLNKYIHSEKETKQFSGKLWK